MMLRSYPWIRVAFALLVLTPLAAQTWRAPDDAEAHEQLRRYVEEHRLAPGVVVGIWEQQAPPERQFRFFAHGRSGRREVPLDEHTLFELGSITKGFTGLLLADWSLRTDRPLTTSLAAVSGEEPASGPLAEITLLDLATHRSGLPRLPTQPSRLLPMLFSRDPYAGTTADDVLTAAATVPSRRPPGDFAYSNLGYAVLGQALAGAAGREYEELIRERVLEPLGFTDAWWSPAAAPAERLAQGFGTNLRPVPHWHLDGYAPAGGLISDAHSLLAFLARMAVDPPPLWNVATRAHHELDPAAGREIGLGWMRRVGANGTLIWHNGGTGGFRTFCGVVPEAGLAVVTLTNGLGNADALALALIESGRAPPAARSRPGFGYLLAGFGIILAPGLAWMSALSPPRPTAKSRVLDRVDVVSFFTAAAFLLTVSARHGAWQWLPFAGWWFGALLTLAAVVPAARRWRGRRWLSGAPWWQALRVAQLGVFALVLGVLLR